MKKNKIILVLAVFLAVLMPLTTVYAASAKQFADNQGNSLIESNLLNGKKYASPDINKITGMGQEPEEISVSAGATYQEKAWYEYVTYSDKAVCSYRIDDDHRLLFYDPYTYTNAMVMDVQFDANTTEFDTMSEYTVSHSTSKSIDACISSTDTTTSCVQTSGKDYSETTVNNGGTTKTIYNHSIDNPTYGTVTEVVNKDYKEYRYKTSSETEESSVSGGAGTKNLWGTVINTVTSAATGNILGVAEALGKGLEVSTDASTSHSNTTTDNAAIVLDKETTTTTYSDDYKTSTEFVGSDTVEYDTESKTTGWSQLSARVTKTIGSSSSTSNSWSESESTTVTKTYAATHFASDGVTPLPWAIVHYSVQMPMKCCLQVKYSGEWVTISTVYCLLTTVQGTCRAWMQNGQVYYEDWGSGEPVVETQFWSQFMTKEQLMNAYSNKLYPVGGDN